MIKSTISKLLTLYFAVKCSILSIYLCVKCVKRKCNNRPHERDVEIGPISRHCKIH